MFVVDPRGDDDTSNRTSPYSVRALIISSPGNTKHSAFAGSMELPWNCDHPRPRDFFPEGGKLGGGGGGGNFWGFVVQKYHKTSFLQILQARIKFVVTILHQLLYGIVC